jgi:NhaP-type Na+/H+ or K+/H+ antiporter
MKQKFTSQDRNWVLFWVYVVVASTLLLTSCSRKVITNTSHKDSLSQISTKIATDEVFKTQTNNNIITDEFTIEPLDTCKDIVINGRSYRNAVLRHKVTKDNTTQVQDKKVSKIEEKQQNTKVEVKEKKKEIDKKENYFKYIVFVAIIFVIWLNKKTFI